MIGPKKQFMREAIKLALSAREEGDYAIGSVVVKGEKIIASASNRSKRDENPVGHAETIALTNAARALATRHIEGCILYSTHEPCAMCAAACYWAKIRGIVFGARYTDMKQYAEKHPSDKLLWRTKDLSAEDVINKTPIGNRIEIVGDFMREECVKLFHN